MSNCITPYTLRRQTMSSQCKYCLVSCVSEPTRHNVFAKWVLVTRVSFVNLGDACSCVQALLALLLIMHADPDQRSCLLLYAEQRRLLLFCLPVLCDKLSPDHSHKLERPRICRADVLQLDAPMQPSCQLPKPSPSATKDAS